MCDMTTAQALDQCLAYLRTVLPQPLETVAFVCDRDSPFYSYLICMSYNLIIANENEDRPVIPLSLVFVGQTNCGQPLPQGAFARVSTFLLHNRTEPINTHVLRARHGKYVSAITLADPAVLPDVAENRDLYFSGNDYMERKICIDCVMWPPPPKTDIVNVGHCVDVSRYTIAPGRVGILVRLSRSKEIVMFVVEDEHGISEINPSKDRLVFSSFPASRRLLVFIPFSMYDPAYRTMFARLFIQQKRLHTHIGANMQHTFYATVKKMQWLYGQHGIKS